jgi:hypothetical protein
VTRRCCECGERIDGDERVEFGEWRRDGGGEVTHVTHRGECAQRFETRLLRQLAARSA